MLRSRHGNQECSPIRGLLHRVHCRHEHASFRPIALHAQKSAILTRLAIRQPACCLTLDLLSPFACISKRNTSRTWILLPESLGASASAIWEWSSALQSHHSSSTGAAPFVDAGCATGQLRQPLVPAHPALPEICNHCSFPWMRCCVQVGCHSLAQI